MKIWITAAIPVEVGTGSDSTADLHTLHPSIPQLAAMAEIVGVDRRALRFGVPVDVWRRARCTEAKTGSGYGSVAEVVCQNAMIKPEQVVPQYGDAVWRSMLDYLHRFDRMPSGSINLGSLIAGLREPYWRDTDRAVLMALDISGREP